eukprot:TRINITY_DN256_c0_g1_i3.p1 TRINITY_DN256_c0_g1~~TRINITY_DN256_c0_g1_i3.p1  ORF type:complete len:456 (+),score=137.75 TRINITY_DN256_c0_g1_i3:277-1644(+)
MSSFTQLSSSDVILKRRVTPKTLQNRYFEGNTIGSGSYSVVKEGYDITFKRMVAIKIIKKKCGDLTQRDVDTKVQREIAIMKKLDHPNVVSLIDDWADPTKCKIYLVMQYVRGGTLQNLIDKSETGKIPFLQCKTLFNSLLLGLEYIHSKGIFHRDIKTDNLLLVDENNLRIVDFGTAVEVPESGDLSTLGVGSTAFQPPEVATTGTTSSGYKLDAWAAGMTLYLMVTGRYPFVMAPTPLLLFETIARCEYEMPTGVPKHLASLLRGVLQPDPVARLSVEQMLEHQWLTASDCSRDSVDAPFVQVSQQPTMFTPESLATWLAARERHERKNTHKGAAQGGGSSDDVEYEYFRDVSPDAKGETIGGGLSDGDGDSSKHHHHHHHHHTKSSKSHTHDSTTTSHKHNHHHHHHKGDSKSGSHICSAATAGKKAGASFGSGTGGTAVAKGNKDGGCVIT